MEQRKNSPLIKIFILSIKYKIGATIYIQNTFSRISKMKEQNESGKYAYERKKQKISNIV